MVDGSGRACGTIDGGGVTSRHVRARASRCSGNVGEAWRRIVRHGVVKQL